MCEIDHNTTQHNTRVVATGLPLVGVNLDDEERALGRLRCRRRNVERALRADRRRLGRVRALVERDDSRLEVRLGDLTRAHLPPEGPEGGKCLRHVVAMSVPSPNSSFWRSSMSRTFLPVGVIRPEPRKNVPRVSAGHPATRSPWMTSIAVDAFETVVVDGL